MSSLAPRAYSDQSADTSAKMSAAVTASLSRARPTPTRALRAPTSIASVALALNRHGSGGGSSGDANNSAALPAASKRAMQALSDRSSTALDELTAAYVAASPAHAELLRRVAGHRRATAEASAAAEAEADAEGAGVGSGEVPEIIVFRPSRAQHVGAANEFTDRAPLVSKAEPDLATRLSLPRHALPRRSEFAAAAARAPEESLAVGRHLRQGAALHKFRVEAQSLAIGAQAPVEHTAAATDRMPFSPAWTSRMRGHVTAALVQAQEVGHVQLQLLERRRRGRYFESDMNLSFALNPYGSHDSPYSG
jgi:hypothetical protein